MSIVVRTLSEQVFEIVREKIGGVEMWRGGDRFGLSVAAPFVWRCLSNLAVAPFPHPSHRTEQAQLTHSALGQDIRLLPTEGCACEASS